MPELNSSSRNVIWQKSPFSPFVWEDPLYLNKAWEKEKEEDETSQEVWHLEQINKGAKNARSFCMLGRYYAFSYAYMGLEMYST